MTTFVGADTRTILHESDATGGWTSTDGPTLFTTAPSPIEETGCLAFQASSETQDAYDTFTAIDMRRGGTLSLWIQDRAEFETTANVGIGLQLGDGGDRIAFAVGGSDGTAFRHDTGPVKWACFLLDPANLPADTVVLVSIDGLNLASITQAGLYVETVVKSVGGADNVFWDIMRWAEPGEGVTFRGGTTAGAAGNGSEAAVIDRNTGSTNAYGVIRELAGGVYGVQGNLTIGDSTSATAQFWEETSVTYAFEDRSLGDINYYRFNIVGRTGQTSSAIFTSSTFSVPAAAAARIDANGADLDVVTMASCTFIGVSVGIVGSDDTGDDWTGCTYVDCGPLEINGCDHTGSTFSGTLEGALIEGQDETSYDDTATEGDFLTFSEGPTGYAASDTVTLTNGALITIDAVTTGAPTQFTVTTSEGYPASEGQRLEQASTSGSGTGWAIWPRSANLAEGGSIFYDEAVDPDGELDDMTFTMGADDTHAAVFGTSIPSEITLRGWTLTGYNASDSQPDSMLHFLDTSGTITVNVIDGPGAVSYKSEGATIDIVISPVTTKVTCEDASGTMLENVRVLLETADDGGGSGLPYQAAVSTLTQSSGTATLTASAVHGLATNDYVVVRGAAEQQYNKQAQITVTSTTVFTYAVDSGAPSPATKEPGPGLYIDAQDETSYDGSPSTEGVFTGGSDYVNSEIITMDSGTTVTVDLQSGTFVTQFTVDNSTQTSDVTAGEVDAQASSDGIGNGFTMTPENDNIIAPDIVFSYAAISGLTATTGIIQSSKSWPASQGLTGWARKSTTSPYYKTSPISIADASGGTDLLVLMLSDE